MSDIYRQYPIEPYSGGGSSSGPSLLSGSVVRRLLTGRFSKAAFRDAAVELALTTGIRVGWNAIEPRAFAVFEATLLGDKHRDFVKMISHGMERSVITRQAASDGQAVLVPPRFTVFKYDGAIFFAESEFRVNTIVKLYTLRKNHRILNKLSDKYFGGNGSKMLRTVTDRNNARMSLVRPLNTVIVTPEVQKNVLDAIEKWWVSKDEYARLGRQWKITICLHGVPGCGKSSLERGVAGNYGGDMRVVNCADIDDAGLYEALRGNERVVVLEEFYPPSEVIEETTTLNEELDRQGDHSGDITKMSISKRRKTKLTLQGAKAAFDGADVIHDKIIFINTNYPDKFPASLRRPGRIDVFQEMPLPGDREIKYGFFPLYFPGEPIPEGVTFERRSGGRIQKCLDLCDNDPKKFVELVLAQPPAEEDED